MIDLLTGHRTVAIVRGDSAEAARATVRTLVEEGIVLLEVSLVTPGALDVVREAVAEFPDAVVGVGTVRTADDAERSRDTGAAFVVTPADGAGARTALRLGVPVLLGALTPTEVEAAVTAGATAVKLFPASLGGPGYLRALRDPMPDVPFVPVGGVGAAEASDYLAAGAVAVGVGSPLVGDAARGGDLAALRDRVRRWRETVP